MAEEDSSTSSSSRPRRSSFAGQTLADLFGNGRSMPRNPESDSGSPPNRPGPITQAAAQAQRRRLSLTTLGLSGEPPSRYSASRGPRNSLDSANSGSIDESAIEDEPGAPDPTTPFARRMSFGAKALRDVRNSGGGQGNPGQNGTRSPPAAPSQGRARAPSGTISTRDAKGRVEGFNWSENLRTRAERTSIASQGGAGPSPAPAKHVRAQSVAVMEPPVRAIPREPQRPDAFQERILKGDFYMD